MNPKKMLHCDIDLEDRRDELCMMSNKRVNQLLSKVDLEFHFDFHVLKSQFSSNFLPFNFTLTLVLFNLTNEVSA